MLIWTESMISRHICWLLIPADVVRTVPRLELIVLIKACESGLENTGSDVRTSGRTCLFSLGGLLVSWR